MEWLSDRHGGDLGPDFLGEEDALLDGLGGEMGERHMAQHLAQPAQQAIAFCTFCRNIDSDAVTKIFEVFADFTERRYGAIHLLFQSTGGLTPEGIALFNYFKTFPIELHLYNVGQVASAALTAFAGAEHRYASTHATFLFHKATSISTSEAPMTAFQHEQLAKILAADEARIEAILKSVAQIPPEKWTAYETAYATITAQEARQYGLIEDIREFQPPAGSRLFDI
jgi:ATP-dependent protease ClpP protease subunit